MQNDANYIIDTLGIASLDDDVREDIVDEAYERIGDAVSQGLSDEQQSEYQRIIDGDQSIIDEYLNAHLPNYKEMPMYKQIMDENSDNPEAVGADKVLASFDWVQRYVPDIQARTDEALNAYRQELLQGGVISPAN